MEFYEKLQELRKSRGLTQEELAENLYVSRTAISKWESGRGYPGIESLKAIANYFSVTIDELLSGEKLLSIAEQENRANLRSICDLLFGMIDVSTFLLIFLPLYPNRVDGYIYSVSLFNYTQITALNCVIYWTMFVGLIGLGILRVVLVKVKAEKGNRIVMDISMGLGILMILLLAITRESYAIVVALVLLVAKGVLLLKCVKNGGIK